MKSILILILFFLTTALLGQTRLYVNASAQGQNDGSSWADAFTELQTALATAAPSNEIWVAQGTYFPTTDNNRDSSFNLPSGVHLYGGFAGTETSLSERDWAAHSTVLSGDIGVPGDSSDNSFTILYMDNPDSLTLVDGFQFEWGNANSMTSGEPANGPRRCGGALYIMGEDGEAYPTIRNCHFEHNTARFGGAVFINGLNNGSVAPMFLNCVFERNTATQDGGGVYRKGSSWAERTPDFGGCAFLNNFVQRWGGGIFYQDSEATDTLQVWDSRFIGNTKGLGAGFFLSIGRQDGSKVDVQRCDFQLNSGSYGAVFHISNIFSFSNTDFVLIKDSNISNNSGFGEGMVYVDGFGATDSSSTVIDNCVFSGNHQIGLFGPPLLNLNVTDKGRLSISNTVIQWNRLGGLIGASSKGKLSINHCVVANNKESTNGIFLAARNNHNVEVNNTMFYNNAYNSIEVPIISLLNATVTIRNSFLQGRRMFYHVPPSPTNPITTETKVYNSVLLLEEFLSNEADQKQTPNTIIHSVLNGLNFDCITPPPGVTCGPGNLFNLDPLFRDTANGDYSLLPCSPLINAGSNAAAEAIATDLAGNPRILGGTVDMGPTRLPGWP